MANRESVDSVGVVFQAWKKDILQTEIGQPAKVRDQLEAIRKGKVFEKEAEEYRVSFLVFDTAIDPVVIRVVVTTEWRTNLPF